MKRERLVPRPIPVGVGFAIPHSDLYRATKRLLRDVARAEDEAREEVAALRSQGIDARYHPSLDVELYAAAVVVFSAMTMEAAIDLYRVARFGPPAKRKGRPPGPVWEYLRCLLSASLERELGGDEPIFGVVQRTFETRNNLVHPKSFEAHFDRKGPTDLPPEEELFPELDGDAARTVCADLDTFFSEMYRLDSIGAGMLLP